MLSVLSHSPRKLRKSSVDQKKSIIVISMTIFIRNYTGELISLSQNTTVNGIKDAIWKRLGIYPDDQRLIFAGKQLDDNVYKVPTGSIVDLSLRLCGGKKDKVNCAGSWNSPTCPTDCGKSASTVNETWITTTRPKHGGRACPSSPRPKTCAATSPCPVDCAGSWNSPTCPTDCGKSASTVNETWITTTTPKHGGRACPSSPRPKTCAATSPCPVNCVGSYEEPKPCPTDCGLSASKITQKYNVTTPAQHGGTACLPNKTIDCPETAACPTPSKGESKDKSNDKSKDKSKDKSNEDSGGSSMYIFGGVSSVSCCCCLLLLLVLSRR
jgi:hypothetical protein